MWVLEGQKNYYCECDTVDELRNNYDKPAGWYIERTGLKKLRIGGVMVAHEHANWIVNTGNSSAANVKTLISKIQKKVYTDFGFSLQREVIYVPDDILEVNFE